MGQHPARRPNKLSPYREVLHIGLLRRPQARSQRDGQDRRLNDPLVHRQQHRPARRPRSVHIRLEVDRPDPENRNFRHPDPIAWTTDHRAEILRALYTILIGNPMLEKTHDAPMKTRFKTWYRLIGSAVEYAAKQAGEAAYRTRRSCTKLGKRRVPEGAAIAFASA